MATENFFKETREQSRVKSEIIEKYFDTWAKIITSTQDRQNARTGARSDDSDDLEGGAEE